MKNLSPTTIQKIEEALREGNKIQAIKIYKEATDEGLLESKEAIESWNLSAQDDAQLWQDKFYAPKEKEISETEIQEKVREYVQDGQKIEAIKWIKTLKKWSLKEAKDYVEAQESHKQSVVFLPPPKQENPFIDKKGKEEYNLSATSFENTESAQLPEFQQTTHKEGRIDMRISPLTEIQESANKEKPFIVNFLIALILTILIFAVYRALS
jgi:ribosomal protein L7/L12